MLRDPTPQAGGAFGEHVWIVDLDQDGKGELLVGAPYKTVSGKAAAGEVIIRRGLVTEAEWIQPWVVLTEPVISNGPQVNAWFGQFFVSGDFNGDTFVDLAVAAPGADLLPGDGTAVPNGRVTVFYGPWDLGAPQPYSWSLAVRQESTHRSDPTWDPFAAAFGNHFGLRMAVGDFNVDGKDDLAVGAPFSGLVTATVYYQQAGRAYVLWGGSGLLGGLDETVYEEVVHIVGGLGETDRLWGMDLAAGNIRDEQGFAGEDDLVVAAYNREVITPGGNQGDFVMYYNWRVTSSFTRGVQVTAINGPLDQGELGWRLDAGDANNDGFTDIAASMFFQGVIPEEIHVFYGGPSFPSDAANHILVHDVPPPFSFPNVDFGHALCFLDLDGDGEDELAASAPGSVFSLVVLNRVFLMDGQLPYTPPFTWIDDPTPEALIGWGASLEKGALNLNAKEDLAIGNPGATGTSGAGEGEVRVLIW